MKYIKSFLRVTAVLVLLAVCAAVAALGIQRIRTDAVLDDYSCIYTDQRYRLPLMIEDVEVIRQEISCGYAVIGMFSSWNGDPITEQSLFDRYGKVVTSTGKAFSAEMNRLFPAYTTVMHRYLKNTELIGLVYDDLAAGIPVPVEWAAVCGDQWTLHYSLVIGADIPADRITVANPYGYLEEITVAEFLDRTSFEAFENMPLFLRLGFAFGVFEKNTVFSVRKNAS